MRELKNLIEALVAIGRSRVIRRCEVEQHLEITLANKPSLSEINRDMIESALRKACGNRTEAARLLGISRSTLWYRMKSLGIN